MQYLDDGWGFRVEGWFKIEMVTVSLGELEPDQKKNIYKKSQH